MCSQIYSNIIQVFALFMKAIFPRSDTRPTQVGDMHPPPVTCPNLSNLIGWGQKIFINIVMEYAFNYFSIFVLDVYGVHFINVTMINVCIAWSTKLSTKRTD